MTLSQWEKKTSKILRDYFKSPKDEDEESQKCAIIKTDTNFMKSDIKTNIPSVTDQYPLLQS